MLSVEHSNVFDFKILSFLSAEDLIAEVISIVSVPH